MAAIAYLKTDCEQCDGPIEYPSEIGGQSIECPHCQHTITLPTPSPLPQTRSCPFCGEQILSGARKCKHCGEFLDATLRQTRPATTEPQQPQLVRTAKSRGIYIILGLFLGGLFGIHNFYAGRYGSAVAQLIIIIFLGWLIIGIVINAIWVLIELLTVTTDGNGNQMT